jgi:hypothetical protein
MPERPIDPPFDRRRIHNRGPVVYPVDGRLLLDWPDDIEPRTLVDRAVLDELVAKVNAARMRAELAGDLDGWP